MCFRSTGTIELMSETPDLFACSPSILRMPSWLGPGVHEERDLPFESADYEVIPGDRWTVTALKTGETVYCGIGPVEVVST